MFALLLFCASGSAERRMDVPGETIAGIIFQVGKGAAEDVLGRRWSGSKRHDYGSVLRSVRLEIDGQPRTGIFSWLAAFDRTAGYALDRKTEGSVRLRYHLNIQGYGIERESVYRNDEVTLTTSTGWVERVPITKRLTREVPISVAIEIAATETAAGTHLRGTARGTADTRAFTCPIVQQFAANRAADTLDLELGRLLATVERRGTAWFHAGEFSPEFDRLRTAIRSALDLRLLGGGGRRNR